MGIGTILLIVIAAVAAYGVFAYNKLVSNKNLVAEGWSGIDVQLRRRADLVPNLVETVKGYAAHERGLFEEIAASRQQSLAAKAPAEQGQAERRVEGAPGRLMALAEAYPEL